MSTSSSRRQQQRRPRRLAPLKPTTDLDVIEAGAPAVLARPRVPPWIAPLILGVLALTVIMFPVREALAGGAYRKADATWSRWKMAEQLRSAQIGASGAQGDERDLYIAEVLDETARNFEAQRRELADWRARLDPDVRRAHQAVDVALRYEIERLRSAAASYREHWSAGVSPCCGRVENASRRANVLLENLREQYD